MHGLFPGLSLALTLEGTQSQEVMAKDECYHQDVFSPGKRWGSGRSSLLFSALEAAVDESGVQTGVHLQSGPTDSVGSMLKLSTPDALFPKYVRYATPASGERACSYGAASFESRRPLERRGRWRKYEKSCRSFLARQPDLWLMFGRRRRIEGGGGLSPEWKNNRRVAVSTGQNCIIYSAEVSIYILSQLSVIDVISPSILLVIRSLSKRQVFSILPKVTN